MPRDGRIIDIRYYTAEPKLDAGLLDGIRSGAVGLVICRKLRARGLRLGAHDHVYFTFVSAESVGVDASPSGHAHLDFALGPPGPFFHNVTCRVDPARIIGLSSTAREQLVAEATCRGLAALCEDEASRALVEEVRKELAKAGEIPAVEYLVKETGSYKATVLYEARPMKPGPLKPIHPTHQYFATLVFEDKATGARGFARVLDFNMLDDLHSACGAITVKGGTIFIKPRRGHNFGTPILIQRAELEPTADGF